MDAIKSGQQNKLSYSQEWLWKVCQYITEREAFHIPFAYRAEGELDEALLIRCLQALLQRHEGLRVAFPETDGIPKAMVLPDVGPKISRYRLDDEEAGSERDEQPNREAELLTRLARQPFDLEKGPLFRVSLLETGPHSQIVLFVAHHLVFDYDSIGIFMRELSVLYHAGLHEGEPSGAPPTATLRYEDYASRQRERVLNDSAKAELEYWEGALRGAPRILPVPASRARPLLPTLRGTRLRFRLPGSLAEPLSSLAVELEVSLFTVMLTAWKVLLYRWSGQADLVVGNHVVGRQTELEGAIGFYLETLALRSDLSGDPSLAEAAQRVQRVVRDAYANRAIPFELLLKELRLNESLSHASLFQVLFTMESGEHAAPAFQLGGTLSERVDVELNTAKFDLSLILTEEGDGIKGELEYAADLFDEEPIRQMIEHYQEILESFAQSNGALVLSGIELSTSRIPQRKAGPETLDPAELERTLPEQFRMIAQQFPDRLAIRTNRCSWSYAEVDRLSNQLAHVVLGAAGSGNVVALLLDHDTTILVGILGALKAGKTYVALDPAYPKDRLVYILQDSEATSIVCDSSGQSLAAELAAGRVPVLHLAETDKGDGSRLAPELTEAETRPDRPAYILYTSGSTGQPKGIVQTHRNVLHHMRTYASHLGFRAEDRLSLVSSYSWDAGLMDVVSAFVIGSGLYPYSISKEGLDGFLDWAEDNELTVLHMPIPVFRSLIAILDGNKRGQLRHARRLVLGGDFIRAGDVEAFKRHFHPECILVNAYGPTESTTCLLQLFRHGDTLTHTTLPLGFPVDRTEVYLENEGGVQAALNGMGEIRIRSPYISSGYWRKDELTKATFLRQEDGTTIYRTGDLGKRLPDGSIAFLGRQDFQVKIRGYRVELGEVEAALAAFPGIQDAVVTAKLKETGSDQKRLVAYYVADPNATVAEEHLRAYLTNRLPDYMIPALFMALNGLHLTPNRKIDRKSLPEPDWSYSTAQQPYEAPRNEEEARWVAIWAELLGIPDETISVHDDFFELGGDSLLALRSVSRARAFGMRVSPALFLKLRTVEKLADASANSFAAFEEEEEPSSTGTQDVRLMPVHYHIFKYKDAHFLNTPIVLEPLHPVDPGMVSQALLAVINWHDGLRLSFTGEGLARSAHIDPPYASFRMQQHDLSFLPPDEHNQAFLEIAEEMHRSFDLVHGPLIQARLVRFGLGGDRVLLMYHMCVMDLYGHLLFLEDFVEAYKQLQQGETMETIRLPETTTSYKKWGDGLARFADSSLALDELPYWSQLPWDRLRLPAIDHPEELPPGFPNKTRLPRLADPRSEQLELSRETTAFLLKEGARQLGVSFEEIMIALYAASLSSWTGSKYVLIDYIMAGRLVPVEDVDISRTIGPAASTTPLVLEILPGETASLCRSVHNQLRQIPNEKFGYGALRHFSSDPAVRAFMDRLPLPQFSFKYNGSFDKEGPLQQLFRYTNEPTGQSSSEENRHAHRYLLRTNTGLSEDGSYFALFIYNQNLFASSTIRSFALCFDNLARQLLTELQNAQYHDDRLEG